MSSLPTEKLNPDPTLIWLVSDESIVARAEPTEPEDFTWKIRGRIKGLLADSDEETVLGNWIVLRVRASQNGVAWTPSAAYLYDTEQATADAYGALVHPEDPWLLNEATEQILDAGHDLTRMLVIDRVTVLPTYRGRRIGLIAMQMLIRVFAADALGMPIVLKPFPLQFDASFKEGSPLPEEKDLDLGAFLETQEQATAKLRKYYKRLGFKRVPGTDFMILSSDRALPSVADLLA